MLNIKVCNSSSDCQTGCILSEKKLKTEKKQTEVINTDFIEVNQRHILSLTASD